MTDDATAPGRTRRAVLGGVAAALAAGAGCGEATETGRTAGEASGAATPTAVPAADGGAATGRETATVREPPGVRGAYAEVYRETISSVVVVRTYGRAAGQGSGFVGPGGRLLTNHHVVADAGQVRVGFRGGAWRRATVVGSDPYSDLAVLRVDDRPPTATPLSFVEADPPVGTPVVALGAPFALTGTASAGVVSGQDRSLDAPSGFAIPDAVQTDAAVNPGNSGGPLTTLDGRVAGVITAGGGENIGFAVSAALARRVVPALASAGRYRHPYLGARLADVTPPVAAANGVEPRGVLVVDTVAGGPADGVLRGSDRRAVALGQRVPVGGDVIRGLGGRETPALADLSAALALSATPGEELSVRFLRDGAVRTAAVTVGARPPP